MTYYFFPRPYRMMRRWMSTSETPMRDFFLGVDLREDEEGYVLTAFVPGLKGDDLDIQVMDDIVRIEGEYKTTAEADYLLKELPNGSFARTLRLPAPIDADRVEAKINDGILTLRLPKAESARPKKIKINAK
jgi:HSP20 family protein